ncbi:MAG: DUF932 domain-containing protein [Acidobacteria bacterium]|nr:DUF932 domain-containing protein [Acidobacteriota bacterium]
MKTGKSLVELTAEIQRQTESKRDFVASTTALTLHSNGHSEMKIDGVESSFAVTDLAHQQIADRLAIPQKYYNRLQKEQPALLDTNVNTLFQAGTDRRMVRTLDGKARAFLSDRYRRLDNFDLAEAVLPELVEKQLHFESCEITDRKIYLKVISPRTELEVKIGDPVQAGLVISNSEVGLGAVKVEPLIYRLVCTNGMIASDFAQRKYHVGRANDEEATELFRDETLAADDRAFWMKVVDTIRAALSADGFRRIVERLREATEQRITGNPVKSVEVLANRFRLNKDEQSSVLQHLIEGSSLSAYGLMNAVTRAAQDVESYDRATEMEAYGGQVITLSPNDWRVIAEAAY